MSAVTSNIMADRAETIRAIVAEGDAAHLTSSEKALEAGALLVDAKADCLHGEWLPFLERAGVPERKAQRLMTLAGSGLKSDTVSDLGGIKGALRFITLRDDTVSVFASLEFDGWHDVLARRLAGESVGDLPGVDMASLARDARRLMDLQPRFSEMVAMFRSNEWTPEEAMHVVLTGSTPAAA